VTRLRVLTSKRTLTGVHVTLVRVHVRRHVVENVRTKQRLTEHVTHRREEAHLAVLRLEDLMTFRFLLSKSKIKRFAMEEVIHDLLDSLKGRFAGGEVTETKASAGAVGISHDNAALDITVFLEEITKIIIRNRISKVTNVHVGLGRAGATMKTTLVSKSIFTFMFLLCTVDVKLLDNNAFSLEFFLVFAFSQRSKQNFILPFEGLAVHSLLGFDSFLMLFKVYETKAKALNDVTLLVNHDNRRSDITEFSKELSKILSEELLADVLHVKVGVSIIGVIGTEMLGDELLGHKLFTKTLELLDVVLAGFKSFNRVLNFSELDETIAKASTIILGLNLARINATKVRENILELDEGNALVKVLDKDITFTALTLRRIAARPHDTARLALEGFTIKSIKSLLGILRALIIDVSVTKRTLILHITANTDGKDVTAFLESIIDIRLTNIRAEITNIKGTVGISGRSNRSSSRGRLFSRHGSIN